MPNDSLVRSADATLAATALDGLSRCPKTLPPKLFYDEEGCRLFYRITTLPEYYLTRTELALLRRIAPEIAAGLEPPAVLVEYGASDETKAELLLDQTDKLGRLRFAAYVPIDIATEALERIQARMQRHRPELAVCPVGADFTTPVALPRPVDRMSRLGFFPGSTIGNLDPPAARQFLARTRITLRHGARMLVGVDLRKDPAILVPAYDDAAGVTASFNLNLLARLNRDVGADFDLNGFAHRAIWNDAESRIEMHLESRRAQSVQIDGQIVRFVRGETIHTENSYKYSIAGFAELAAAAAWRVCGVWTDPARLFSIHLLAPD
ncbi:MAG TPA: L-histidine N(alpha)-methyltransferase [Acetobacteraceae bacterium]|nr:L-histidine N(alpha)-methyltransferase [Acetobacteraceae bacterium]